MVFASLIRNLKKGGKGGASGDGGINIIETHRRFVIYSNEDWNKQSERFFFLFFFLMYFKVCCELVLFYFNFTSVSDTKVDLKLQRILNVYLTTLD